MNVYVIQTPNGYRVWQAESADHAVEQHHSAFLDEECDEECITRCPFVPPEKCRVGHGCSVCDEAVMGVAIAVKASSEYPGVKSYDRDPEIVHAR